MPYPLPIVQTILNSVNGSKYFAKFDLKSGYWQFPVAVYDRHKLAFQIQVKVYQYTIVAMGHIQSSFHVQKLWCKPSNCEIGVREITFLGHVVSADGI